MQAVGKDQATESGGSPDHSGSAPAPMSGRPNSSSGVSLAGAIFPVPFDGRDLRRLMLKGVKTSAYPHHRLDRRHQQQRHPHRHRQHFADGRRVVAAQKMPRGRRPDEHGATEKRGYRHMEQAIRKRGIKDNRQPVLRDEMAIFDDKTLRRLHPAIGGKDPEGRDQRAKRHHAGGKKCSAGGTLFQPNSITPRNPASRKKAVSTSYSSSGPVILPANWENPLQLVPN